MILGIVQARLSSTRLPGKVLKPILGKPMLWHMLDRLKNSRLIDKLIAATSNRPDDTELAEACEQYGIDCFRGSLNDVLDRFYHASRSLSAETVVRLTGDCPLIDVDVVDRVIDLFQSSPCDYATNTNPPTFPDGLDVEVISMTALETVWHEANLPSEREHVTPYIRKHPDRFRCLNLTHETDLSGMRWTVDEPEDFELVTKLYEALYPDNPDFNMRDVVQYLKLHPELSALNMGFERNEGLSRSLKTDSAEGIT